MKLNMRIDTAAPFFMETAIYRDKARCVDIAWAL